MKRNIKEILLVGVVMVLAFYYMGDVFATVVL